jgi:hypothetical protein
MRPAFSSTKQAAAFALLLLFLLAAPWLSAEKMLPQPKPGYSSESIRWEYFAWVQKFIFEETNDIDIAFVGSSHMEHGIDTPYVQQKLDERLGHPTVVRSICWAGSGFDSLYFFTKDLLDHRHVKTLVFYDECSGKTPNEVQQFVTHWFRFRENGGMLSGLPVADRATYYFASVIGMPRNLLELVTPNLLRDTNSTRISNHFWEKGAIDPATRLGCMSTRTCFDPITGEINTSFVPYVPPTKVTATDIRIYTPATASDFVFSNQPLPAFQTYFARQFGLLVKNHGCKLVLLHLPVYAEKTAPVMIESCYWPDLLQTDVCMMGVPGKQLFAGLSEPEIGQLYTDPVHLNENGQKYFTPLITPALLQFYESHFSR